MRVVSFLLAASVFVIALVASFGFGRKAAVEPKLPTGDRVAALDKNMETDAIVVAGGCFWCIEPLFEMVPGVTEVEVAYAGGKRSGVTYEQVSTASTGHAEAVKVTFDPARVSAKELLELFFTIHDPTTKDSQGPDFGPQYRSAVFYRNDEERALMQGVMDEVNKAKIWPKPVVTTLEPLVNYTRAEEYHQDYYKKFETASFTQKMGMNVSYCTAIIEPKVRKFKEKILKQLKEKQQ